MKVQTIPSKASYDTQTMTEVKDLWNTTVKDRIVQMATKIAIEPVFEADFLEYHSGFRPKMFKQALSSQE